MGWHITAISSYPGTSSIYMLKSNGELARQSLGFMSYGLLCDGFRGRPLMPPAVMESRIAGRDTVMRSGV